MEFGRHRAGGERGRRCYRGYKTGKAALDKRIVDNELWFIDAAMVQAGPTGSKNRDDGGQAQAFQRVAVQLHCKQARRRHGQLPGAQRAAESADDEETAKVLSKILPVVLEQADYESVYSDTWWRKLKQGTGVKGIFWDPGLRNGVGDISIKSMDLLMLYWEPGVEDIQDSPHLFSLAVADNEQLKAQYPPSWKATPAAHWKWQSTSTTRVLTPADKSVVVDWYYKKARDGPPCCTTASSATAWCSTPARTTRPLLTGDSTTTARYPFVFDTLFVEEDSPAGFGYIDVMKDTQTAIDEMNHAMDENVKLSAKARYIIQDGAGINEKELAGFWRRTSSTRRGG